MRISDWSSDVCSSDLQIGAELLVVVAERERTAVRHHEYRRCRSIACGDARGDGTPRALHVTPLLRGLACDKASDVGKADHADRAPAQRRAPAARRKR